MGKRKESRGKLYELCDNSRYNCSELCGIYCIRSVVQSCDIGTYCTCSIAQVRALGSSISALPGWMTWRKESAWTRFGSIRSSVAGHSKITTSLSAIRYDNINHSAVMPQPEPTFFYHHLIWTTFSFIFDPSEFFFFHDFLIWTSSLPVFFDLSLLSSIIPRSKHHINQHSLL